MCIMALSALTLSIKVPSRMTIIITTLCIRAVSITVLSIIKLRITAQAFDAQLNGTDTHTHSHTAKQDTK